MDNDSSLQSNKCRQRYSRNCTGRPLWRTRFRRFFGLKDEPVQSVKMKVETRSGILWRLLHEFALCSLQFRFVAGLYYGFIVWNSIRKKKVKPNKRAGSTARGLLSS